MARKKPTFAKIKYKRLIDFSEGLNNKFAPFLIKDNEVADIQNFNYDEKGTLRMRPGYTRHYAAPFATGPVRGLYNYRKADRTSMLIMAADDKLFYDIPHFVQKYDSQADWDTGTKINVDTTVSAGDVKLATPAAPTFTRSSVAYKSDGRQVDSGVPRFEYAALPAPVWRDTFDTDQIATQYTSGGDVVATWAVSGGVLTGTGGFQATLIKKDLLLQDCEIVVNSDKADNGGIIARYQDNNNYYLLALSDDSGEYPSYNLRFLKRVNGTFITITTTNVTWERGTSKQIKFSCKGSTFEAYFGDVKVISAIDTTFTGGSVGLRNNYATDFRVLDFTVYYVKQGVMMEEGTTNLVDNPSFETDASGWTLSAQAARSNVKAFAGLWSLAVTNPPSPQESACYIVPGINPSTTYTISVWANATLTHSRINIIQLNSSGVSLDTDVNNIDIYNNNGIWRRYTITITTRSDCAKFKLRVITGENGTSGVNYYDAFQVEQKAYATSFHDSTRSAETLTIPTAGVLNSQEGTIEFWWCPINPPASTMTGRQFVAPTIIHVGNYYQDNSWILWCGISSQLKLFVRGSNATDWTGGWTIIPDLSWYQLNRWYHIVVRWGNANTFWVFIDGVKYGPYVSSQPFTGIAGNIMSLGILNSLSGQSNAIYDDLRISSRARTDAEIAAAYNSGQPLGWDKDTTYYLPLDGSLSFPAARKGSWTSPVINITNVSNKASGVIVDTVTLPTGTGRTVRTRTSADQVTWSDYIPLGAGGEIQSPPNNYLQIQVELETTDITAANPTYSFLQVTFDNTPAVTQLASGLSTSALYNFTVQNDYLWIVNGENTNKKWDGVSASVSDMGGSPPIAKYIETHKNYCFLAGNPAAPWRLYISQVGDPENWPVLYFIDIGKGDGDPIVGMRVILDSLVIYKENSKWLLQGDAPSNFVVKKVSDDGAASNWSICTVKDNHGYMGKNGVSFFDGYKSALASEKIEKTIKSLNQHQLGLAAGVYFDNKYMLAVPEGNSNYNNLVLVFDVLRTTWTLYRGINASCWCIWRKYDQDVLLFGSSVTGQVYEMGVGVNDDGNPIDAYVVTKALDFGAFEEVKLINQAIVGASSQTAQNVYPKVSFSKDQGQFTSSITITGAANEVLKLSRIIPSIVGVSMARLLQVKVTASDANAGANIYSITIEYMPMGVWV